MTVAAVVLAAGASRRLGRPKQVLALDGATVLDATLTVARSSECEPIVVVLGGAADSVRAEVDLDGVQVVENHDYGEGCATSIRTALGALPEQVTGIVLMLGDQPRVAVETVQELEATARRTCRRRLRVRRRAGPPVVVRSADVRCAGIDAR